LAQLGTCPASVARLDSAATGVATPTATSAAAATETDHLPTLMCLPPLQNFRIASDPIAEQ
jgi:hypothetical protein